MTEVTQEITPGNEVTEKQEEKQETQETQETEIKEEKKENQEIKEEKKIIENYHLPIKSILDSNELVNILESKIGKYKNSLRKLPINRKDKDYISKLEEGYESSDSGDSVQSTSTVLTSSSSSTYSGFSYMSILPEDINSKINNVKSNEKNDGEFSKIKNEIKLLKTEIPKEKAHDVNNIDNNIINMNQEKENDVDEKINENNEIKNEIKNEKKKENKKINFDNVYPLEYFEIFPYLNKYKIGNESNNVFIEKPILFIKNLILKNYHESMSHTQNKLQLQIFKNSPYYRYNIMKSLPCESPPEQENITCMILGFYQNINEDKKNKAINNFNEKYSNIKSVEFNFIFLGYKNGLIKQNVLITEKPNIEKKDSNPIPDRFIPYREYSIKEIILEEKLEKHVLCMSLSDNEEYLLAGYASGHIIIWKTTNGKYLYIFDNIFEMPAVSCEYLGISEKSKDYLFMASDLVGKVYLIEFKKHLIQKDKINKIVVSKNLFPCLLMKKLKFNKFNESEDFNINKIIKYINEQSYIIILGNLEYIELISINRQPKDIVSMLMIRNPDMAILNPLSDEIREDMKGFYSQKNLRDSLSAIEFPDACFGLGYLGDLIKYADNKTPQILFAYCWKNLIKLYFFSEKLNEILEIGWYLNNSPIIKIDFIGVSLLYLLDKNNNIKIINIKLFNHYSNINPIFDSNDKKGRKNKFLIPISDIISIENPVKTISKTFTETINNYNPFIIKNKYNIYYIEEISSKAQKLNNDKNSHIKHIHLLSFNELFNETMTKENWPIFFCKFIDIIKSGTNTLAFIPENKEIKENKLIEKKPEKIVKYGYLGQFLKKYVNVLDEDDDGLENINEENNYDYISFALEFSIEIGSIDFIYNEIIKMENKNRLKKELIKQMENFILNNKFQDDPNLISKKLINDIIQYYLSRKSQKDFEYEEDENVTLFKIDLILCHLHIDIIKKIDNIENIIQEKKLICSLIYYYSNGLNDFIKPLKYLFSEFSKTEEKKLPKENFDMNFFKRLKLSRGYYRDNYNAFLKSLKSGAFNLEDNLFKSKEFIGHLLLLFIQLTLKGFLFPNSGKIKNIKELDNIISEIFLFLTKKEVAEELIKFDCYSYFETLTLFFYKEEEMNMMINDEMFETFLENINSKNKLICPLIIDNIDLNKLKENIQGYNKINDIKNIKKENQKNNNNKNKIEEKKITKDKKIPDKNTEETKKGDTEKEQKKKEEIKNEENKEKELKGETEGETIENKKEEESIPNLFFELINKIIVLCNSFPENILIKFDLNLFIIYLSLKIDGISNNILKSSLLSIFNFYSDIKKLKLDLNALSILFEKIDKFGNHYSLIRRKQSTLDNISSIINFFINKYYINRNTNADEINNLYKTIFTSYFLGVKIYLYEIKKDYVSCINVYLNEKKKISRRVFAFINKTLELLKQNKDDKTLLIYKNEIKKKVTNLARVSQSETFKIIQSWFNSIDIISSLNSLPKLQFKYIDKLKSIYKRKLKREKDSINDFTKKEYSDILLIYIKLLLYFEKEKRVLKLFKEEEEYLNVNECIKLCLNKSIEASIYLYKLIGDEKSALKICLDKIKVNYDEIKNIKNSIDEKAENLFKEMKMLINECIDICENYSENSEVFKKKQSNRIYDEKNLEKSSENIDINDEIGEEYWLELFGKIYEILKDAQKENGLIFSQIKNYLSEKVENLLLTMSYYVSFNFILKKVSKELEFSLLKNFLNKNIYTKSHLSNLYKSYINLISYKINKDIKVLEINGQKGKNVNLIIKDEEQINSEKLNLIINNESNNKYNYSRTNSYFNIESKNKIKKNNFAPKIFKKCSLCLKTLDLTKEKYNEENNDIIIFKCNHIFHMKCLTQELSFSNKKYNNNSENNFCPKCVNVGMEIFSVGNNKEENIDIINNNNDKLNDEINNEEMDMIEKRKKKIEEKIKKKNFKKLTLLDNNYFEQINILENTLNGY